MSDAMSAALPMNVAPPTRWWHYLRWPDLSYRWLRVWQRNFDVNRILWKSALWEPIMEPVILMIGFGYGVGAYMPKMNGFTYPEFIAPAAVAYVAMFTATFESTFGTYIRMEFQKTFEGIITTPLSMDEVIAGEILWSATKCTITGAIILCVFAALGLFHTPLIALALLTLVAQGLLFASMATIVTALVPSIDFYTYYITGVISPMFLLSGVFFPLERLPAAIQVIGKILPLYHCVHLNRSFAMSTLTPDMLFDLAYLLVVGLVLFALAVNLMRRRLIK